MYLTMVIYFLFCRSPADRQRSNDAKTVNEQPNYPAKFTCRYI